MKNKIIHLDCTLRDGGYYNDWDFSSELVSKYLQAAKSVHIDFVEIGFRFFHNQGFKGAYAYSKEEFLNSLDIPNELKISVMINASDLITNEGLMHERIQTLVPVDCNQSKIYLIRIACTLETFVIIHPIFEILKSKGYMTGVNLMQISNMNTQQLKEASQLAFTSKVDVLYFADSLGSMQPEGIENIVSSFREAWDGEIGIHAHDNKGLALINTLKAIDHGISWVDSTITGMGRGAGNTRTEDLVLELERNKENTANLIPLLEIINTYFNPMKNKYSWGTNPYYYIAAQYSIHPSYIQHILSDYRFREEDILSVIEYFKNEESSKFIFDELASAKTFYHGMPIGSFSPRSLIKNKEVILLGSGDKLQIHRRALESFILREKPLVIALNTKSPIDDKLIDYRIACNPIRLMADVDIHLQLPQPLITPASMLPDYLSRKLFKKELLDYGIGICQDGFEFYETYGIIPSQLVLAYALAFVASGKASKVLMAGFEGFGINDPRNQEINELLEKYSCANPDLNLLAITPTEYIGLESKSIYGM